MLILDQISLQACTGSSANRTASIPKCSPSGFLCATFLDKRGFIKFDHFDVTLFPHTKPPPALPHLLLQSAWQPPSPSLLCAEPEAAALLGGATQTPPSPGATTLQGALSSHWCGTQGGSRGHKGKSGEGWQCSQSWFPSAPSLLPH